MRQMVKFWAAGLAAALCLSGCGPQTHSAGSERSKNSEDVDLQQILVLARPPSVVVDKSNDLSRVRRMLDRISPNDLAQQSGARRVDANALPWLTGSTEGRAFLAAKTNRVLVRGTPRASCPVALTETGASGIPELASKALQQCAAQSAPDCGCQLVAAGSVLLVPRAEVEYATGVSARIRVSALGLDGFLVAEESPDGTILLRDVAGVVGKLERGSGDQVTLSLQQASKPFSGVARPVGYRRGRLAERIYATDPDGNRLSLLIGFAPEELAQFAGAWLAWPPDA